MLDKILNYITLKRKKVVNGANLHIKGRIYIHGRKGGVTLGNNVSLNSGINFNPTSGFDCIHFNVGEIGKIVIGNNVGISNSMISSNSRGGYILVMMP